MLLEFRVKNYLSFKDEVVFSMLTDSSKKEVLSNFFKIRKYKILRSAVIYGANASGKTNLLKAINFMADVLLSRGYINFRKLIPTPFKLSTETLKSPSEFEITFIVKNDDPSISKNDFIVFRYGFIIGVRGRINEEWLYARFTEQESMLFERNKNNLNIGNKFTEGKQIIKIIKQINPQTLFLSIISNVKGEYAILTKMITKWFASLSDTTFEDYSNFTINLIERNIYKYKILKALKYADFNIEDFELEKYKTEENDHYFFDFEIKTYHKIYGKDNKRIGKIKFDFFYEESDGTKQFFKIIGYVFETLKKGGVLFIDEIGLHLHPNLCSLIISLFNSDKVNKKNAQLIFTTHNTMFLNKRTFRRDQIYFVEKDKYGASDLYSLADFGERNDASYDKNYLMGKYGAVPYLGNLEALFED